MKLKQYGIYRLEDVTIKNFKKPPDEKFILSKWLFAEWYDLLNSVVEPKVVPHRKLTAGMCTGSVLEIGAGTGANLEYLNRANKITLSEPDKYMQRKLEPLATTSSKPVELIENSGEYLPFRDNSFDSVLTTLVLCMVQDVDKVTKEAFRVLKPGGRYYFYEHVGAEKFTGRLLQKILDPVWKWGTTGCHLQRDLIKSIKNLPYSKLCLSKFQFSLGIPIVIPNIIGYVEK